MLPLLVLSLALADPDPFDQSGVPIEQPPADPAAAKVVFVAGFPALKLKSGEHEYLAGCALLANMVKQTPGVAPVIAKDGWPKNPDTLKGAKAVVLFVEGGTAHSALKDDRVQLLLALEKAGTGVVLLHSAVDMPNDHGDRMRQLAGAHWEKGHSLRAHWVSEFKAFPDHPVSRGVTPFTIDDGWLWKLRFAPDRKGVTPLLRTKSPKDAGKTSDDDAVVAWAFDRPGGGRSFTFTGGHLHASLKQDGYRRFLTNGVLWAAGQEVPAAGAPCRLDPADAWKHLDKKPAPAAKK